MLTDYRSETGAFKMSSVPTTIENSNTHTQRTKNDGVFVLGDKTLNRPTTDAQMAHSTENKVRRGICKIVLQLAILKFNLPT